MHMLRLPRLAACVPTIVLCNTLLLVFLALYSPIRRSKLQQQALLQRADPDDIHTLQQQLHFLQKMRVKYGQLHCLLYKVGPTGGFCVNKTNINVGGNEAWDPAVCMQLAQLFWGTSVLDLGCGLGHYGKCLAAANTGIKWTGLDGSEGIEAATDGYVKFADLSAPLYLEQRYDWVLSVEVGEHIPKEFEAVFLDNVARNAGKGVVMSWAVPEQPGYAHVNNRPNEYIIKQMVKRGLSYDEPNSSNLRGKATLGWFKNTMMVFVRNKSG